MQDALARFPRAALPEIANFLRYTSNPSPSRFFRIVVLFVKLFLLLVFFVLLIPLFGMIVVFASGHVVRRCCHAMSYESVLLLMTFSIERSQRHAICPLSARCLPRNTCDRSLARWVTARALRATTDRWGVSNATDDTYRQADCSTAMVRTAEDDPMPATKDSCRASFWMAVRNYPVPWFLLLMTTLAAVVLACL